MERPRSPHSLVDWRDHPCQIKEHSNSEGLRGRGGGWARGRNTKGFNDCFTIRGAKCAGSCQTLIMGGLLRTGWCTVTRLETARSADQQNHGQGQGRRPSARPPNRAGVAGSPRNDPIVAEGSGTDEDVEDLNDKSKAVEGQKGRSLALHRRLRFSRRARLDIIGRIATPAEIRNP